MTSRIPLQDSALVEHLSWWGLRRFDSDPAYFRWQREVIPTADLARLTELAQRKSAHGDDAEVEVAFYDFSVRPGVLAALYSQRYDYYLAVGPLVASCIEPGRVVLDFGCGPGVLTTYYARRFPHIQFIGIDRSVASVTVAQERAEQLGLKNVRFEHADVDRTAPLDSYDVIIATHALLQSEQDPGIPSAHWQTFERPRDPRLQRDFEQRTGVGPRLTNLTAALSSDGRFVVFEKTRQLARRIPFQRAFASRDYVFLESPRPIRYTVVEEVADDGPFYVLSRAPSGRHPGHAWDEAPECEAEGKGQEKGEMDIAQLRHSTGRENEPLYENHSAAAQVHWEGLSDRRIIQEMTRDGPDGMQLHVETGRAQGLSYLYCANTFDQRQLVLVKPDQVEILEAYYQEIVQSIAERMTG